MGPRKARKSTEKKALARPVNGTQRVSGRNRRKPLFSVLSVSSVDTHSRFKDYSVGPPQKRVHQTVRFAQRVRRRAAQGGASVSVPKGRCGLPFDWQVAPDCEVSESAGTQPSNFSCSPRHQLGAETDAPPWVSRRSTLYALDTRRKYGRHCVIGTGHPAPHFGDPDAGWKSIGAASWIRLYPALSNRPRQIHRAIPTAIRIVEWLHRRRVGAAAGEQIEVRQRRHIQPPSASQPPLVLV
jgi:hypothetical protein